MVAQSYWRGICLLGVNDKRNRAAVDDSRNWEGFVRTRRIHEEWVYNRGVVEDLFCVLSSFWTLTPDVSKHRQWWNRHGETPKLAVQLSPRDREAIVSYR